MKYLSILLIILNFGVADGMEAQEESQCLEPRFIPGQTVRVVGSVDMGGMPYRAEAGFENEILGFIPLETVLTTSNQWQAAALCVEERNWYETWFEQENKWVWIVDGDGYSYWLQPDELCMTEPNPLNVDDSIGMLENVEYLADKNSLQLTTMNDENYLLNFETGILSRTSSVHTNIVKPDFIKLINFLRSYPINPVSVSPDKNKVIYAIPSPYVIPDCAHGCHTYYLYVANADGTDMKFFLHTAAENYIEAVHWGTNGRFYITFGSEAVWGNRLLEVCNDGSCLQSLDQHLAELSGLNEVGLNYNFAHPSISPSGRYMAVEQTISNSLNPGAIILDTKSNTVIQLPDNGEVAMPIVWESDNVIYYTASADTVVANSLGKLDDDTIIKIALDYDHQTFEVQEVILNGDLFLHTQRIYLLHHNRRFVIYDDYSITVYCIGLG